MNNILLISNNKNLIETFDKRIKLLRSDDNIAYSGYEDAPDAVFADKPDIVLLHETEPFIKTLNLIKYIKTKNCNILLITDNYNRDNILSAYDEGIDDYFRTNSDHSEILIKIINCIKNKNLIQKAALYEKQLKRLEVLSETTGFYSPKHFEEIFEEDIQTLENINCAITVISPDENGKSAYSQEKMVSAIKSALRDNIDFAAHTKSFKFCIINTTGGTEGAIALFERIKALTSPEFNIKAGICALKNYTFQTAEKKAQCALSSAMLGSRDFVIYSKSNTENLDSWLEIPENRNYKIFEISFRKKLEQIITPLFYRLQKKYEDKIPQTVIEQYTDELQSIFKLTHEKQTAYLKIAYPGMTKIVILTNYSGLDSPENSEITLSVNRITNEELTDIMEKFIADFKKSIE